MKRFSTIAAIFLAMVLATPLWGGVVSDDGDVTAEATKGFEHILDLWRDGKFGELYDRTLINGKDTKESFARRMSGAKLKPSCCWEKMQDVSVMKKSSTAVVIRAKIGLDATGEMEYKTKSFKLMKEFGEWRISRADILSLAEAKSSKKSRKHKVKAG